MSDINSDMYKFAMICLGTEKMGEDGEDLKAKESEEMGEMDESFMEIASDTKSTEKLFESDSEEMDYTDSDTNENKTKKNQTLELFDHMEVSDEGEKCTQDSQMMSEFCSQKLTAPVKFVMNDASVEMNTDCELNGVKKIKNDELKSVDEGSNSGFDEYTEKTCDDNNYLKEIGPENLENSESKKNTMEESEDSIDYDESSDEDSSVNNMVLNGRYHFRGNVASIRVGHIFSMLDISEKKENKQIKIMKVIPQINEFGEDKTAKEEIKNLKKLGYTKYATEFLDEFILDDNHCLLFKKEKTSFDRLLAMSKSKKMTNRTVFRICRDVSKGLDYCHSFGVQHRDVRPSSMILSNDDYLMLSGFGFSSQILRNRKGNGKIVQPKYTYRRYFKNRFSTPCQIRNEEEYENQDFIQLCYSLLVFKGMNNLINAENELNAKVHFECYPHSWITEEGQAFLPLIKLYLYQKVEPENSIEIDYDKIYKLIEECEPGICSLSPYQVTEKDGFYCLE